MGFICALILHQARQTLLKLHPMELCMYLTLGISINNLGLMNNPIPRSLLALMELSVSLLSIALIA